MRFIPYLILVALVGPAFAADNTVVLTPGTGVTMRTRDVGSGIESPLQIPGDTSGNPLATVPGTPNAVFALPIQGVTGGSPVPISGTVAATESGTWTVQPGNTANTTAWLFNLGSMGGTAINSGCVAALSGFSTAIPSTACGVFGAYVLNAAPNGAHNTANSSTVNIASDQVNGNGSAVSANSSPVVIASDQAAFPVKDQVSTNNAFVTPHICGSALHLQASTNSDLTIVPVSGSTAVYICDYEFEFTGVGAFYFESATTAASAGSTCSGSLTQIPGTGLWTGLTAATIGKSGSNAYYRGVKGPASNGLCLHTTALSSTTVDVTVFYDQY